MQKYRPLSLCSRYGDSNAGGGAKQNVKDIDLILHFRAALNFFSF
jgi:hypothetical protein